MKRFFVKVTDEGWATKQMSKYWRRDGNRKATSHTHKEVNTAILWPCHQSLKTSVPTSKRDVLMAGRPRKMLDWWYQRLDKNTVVGEGEHWCNCPWFLTISNVDIRSKLMMKWSTGKNSFKPFAKTLAKMNINSISWNLNCLQILFYIPLLLCWRFVIVWDYCENDMVLEFRN